MDPRSHKFNRDMFEFTDKKIKKDEKLAVIQRLGPKEKPNNINRLSVAPKNSEVEPYRLVGDARFPNGYYISLRR